MKEVQNKIANLDGKSRSENIRKNISLSFVLKIFSLGLSYLVVPITINYLDFEQYGVWLTLLSILSWMSFMDVGLGNGLRNKLTESLSRNDINSAKEYISTAYATISTIVFLLFLVLIFIIPNLNWNEIFNVQTIENKVFIELVIIILCFFLFNFVIALYNQLFYAVQESAFTGIGSLMLNTFFIIGILVIKQISHGNLVYLGISYGISMVMSGLILTIYFFWKYRELVPQIKFVKRKRIKDILGIGIKFFIIQIAVVVIFTTDNMIITQVLGPSEVTSYNLVQKLFAVIAMAQTMLTTPLWSAYTEAYVKGDIIWIKKVIKKLNILMMPIIIGAILLGIFANDFIRIWIGTEIQFPKYLIGLMGIYTIISIWNNIYSYFLNGIGKLELPMYSAIIGGLINIPLSIFFSSNLGLGNSGVILGTIISLSIFSVVGPLQTRSVIKEMEKKHELSKKS